MKVVSIKQARKFIETAGVQGIVSGGRTGMLPNLSLRAAFRAVGDAIDKYVDNNPQDTSLREPRWAIGRFLSRNVISYNRRERVLNLLSDKCREVELALEFSTRINAVGDAAVLSAAAFTGIEAPFDLGKEWRWIPPGVFYFGSKDNDPYADHSEKPGVLMMVQGFWMLDHPVTNAEYRVFLRAHNRQDVRNLPRRYADLSNLPRR